ncbi:hypothetical protein ACROYT_G000173 [Oculina patagonica]
MLVRHILLLVVVELNNRIVVVVVELNNRIVVVVVVAVELNSRIVVVVVVAVELNNRIVVVVVVVELNSRIVVVVVVVAVELNNRIVVVVVVAVELNNRIVVVVVELNNSIVVVNPRDKLQILTLAKQMYPGETAWFIKQYEEAVRRPFGYLFIDLKPTTQDSCRLRTNVLPGEERFDNGEEEGSVSKELLQYLKQQNLMAAPVIPEMQRLRNNMDGLLSRNDLGEDEKARQYMQLQNRFLTYKHQLNSIPEATKWAEPQEKKQISTTENLPTVPTPSPELATVPATPVQAPDPQVITYMATSTPLPPSPPPSILTPPPTVEMSPPKKRKRPQIRLVNYLDDKPKRPSRQSRRLHRTSPYKYSKGHEDDY